VESLPPQQKIDAKGALSGGSRKKCPCGRRASRSACPKVGNTKPPGGIIPPANPGTSGRTSGCGNWKTFLWSNTRRPCRLGGVWRATSASPTTLAREEYRARATAPGATSACGTRSLPPGGDNPRLRSGRRCRS
jgi:hypothetical protein